MTPLVNYVALILDYYDVCVQSDIVVIKEPEMSQKRVSWLHFHPCNAPFP